jgi:hypothetical protein
MMRLFVLLLVLLFSGCSVQTIDVPVTTVNSSVPTNIACYAPYMRFGSGCCLDKNNNSVCDSDEKIVVPVIVPRPSSTVFSVSYNVLNDVVVRNGSAMFNVTVVNNKDTAVDADIFFPDKSKFFVFSTEPSFYSDKGVRLAANRSASFLVVVKVDSSTPVGVYDKEIVILRRDIYEKMPLLFTINVRSS